MMLTVYLSDINIFVYLCAENLELGDKILKNFVIEWFAGINCIILQSQI